MARAPVKPAWPADKIERWPIDRLIPYARNARTHSEAQVAQIAASIREWGWTIPVLVAEDGTIIAGHGRVLAARQLGMTEVPVMIARGWTEAQKRAYSLADNKLALNAGWDDELLKLELGDLRSTISYDAFSSIGFSDHEMADLLSSKYADVDASPQLGDLSYSIVIRCKDESDQLEWLQRLQAEGARCEALIS